MDTLIITDPFFYAVAIPAVLLMGISKSGFGVGFGSMAVPLMALAVSVPQAAAILMPILLLIDMLGLAVFRRSFDRELLKFMLPLGLLGTLIGTLLFKVLDAHVVAGIVGGCTLLFLAQRLLFPPKAGSPPPPRWVGGLLTVASGFTSFVAHAGSPPISAYVIPLRLSPLKFAATMAIFFTAINLAKWIPYAWLGLFGGNTLMTSLVLLPVAPLGVWLGLRLAKRISPVLFYRLVYLGMFLTGSKLLWDGLH
ncbi:MAG: sulfite exporter TauE/SafE family protein [Gammaproteobacteria bacterium]|nr:sulfite exporter TauE/SafE family protein [Gammaproteobacteria bacterium]MBU0787627.1 sulfite exporter TauE/SafE family protein [Gammaproteobacteria bacterium]MBU0814903.1 sulfite exporter TauE/SafE family protein [Gammaproteobacteria bacterium]MBU1785989.1 sulfite exporter TauE/SafE family protein [Gammaproteobacteria bacterium]